MITHFPFTVGKIDGDAPVLEMALTQPGDEFHDDAVRVDADACRGVSLSGLRRSFPQWEKRESRRC
jgi:hypothetical protein